jgi:hypothetical protein
MVRFRIGVMVGTAVVGAWLMGAGSATATMALQKKAKEAGYPATSCLYCHNEKLPKKDATTHNDRGKFLIGEKEKLKLKEVDVSWLKNYKEPENK